MIVDESQEGFALVAENLGSTIVTEEESGPVLVVERDEVQLLSSVPVEEPTLVISQEPGNPAIEAVQVQAPDEVKIVEVITQGPQGPRGRDGTALPHTHVVEDVDTLRGVLDYFTAEVAYLRDLLDSGGSSAYFQVSSRFAELTTPEAKAQARQNLDLQNIDGGSF